MIQRIITPTSPRVVMPQRPVAAINRGKTIVLRTTTNLKRVLTANPAIVDAASAKTGVPSATIMVILDELAKAVQ